TVSDASQVAAAVSDAPQRPSAAIPTPASAVDLPDRQSPPALALALPKGAPAARQAEVANVIPDPPAGMSMVKRPAPIASSQPALPAVQVALTPEVTGGRPDGSATSSLVVAIPSADAAPAPPAGLRAASPDVATETPRTIKLALPEAPTARTAAAAESAIA